MSDQGQTTFAARQDFNSSVENVAGRDVNNLYVSGTGRNLTKEERNALHSKVLELESKFEEPSWQTWKFLHRCIGVDKIDGMRIEHRDPAHAILDLLIEKFKLTGELRAAQRKTAEAPPAVVISASDKIEMQRLRQTIKDQEQRISAILQANSALEKSSVSNHTIRYIPWGIAGALLFSTGLMSFLAASEREKANDALAKVSTCSFEDKAYAVGAVLSNSNKEERICSLANKDRSPEWVLVKSPPKLPMAKKPIRRRSPDSENELDNDY